MKISFEELGGFFPANAQATEVLYPSDGALDGPTAYVSAKGSSVLCFVLGLAVGLVRRDHFNAHLRQGLIQRIAIVGLVADEAFGRLFGEHEIKQALNQFGFVGIGGHGVDGDRQTLRIHHHHDFHALSDAGAADSVPAAARFAKGAVDEAFVQLVLTLLLDQVARVSHDGFEDALAYPSLEPPVHGALRSETRGQVFPFRAVIEHPKDALNNPSLVRGRSTALRTSGGIRDTFTEPIELRIGKF